MTVDAIVGVLAGAVFDIAGGVFVLRQQYSGRQKEETKRSRLHGEKRSQSYCGR
jgi:hypothetical protein